MLGSTAAKPLRFISRTPAFQLSLLQVRCPPVKKKRRIKAEGLDILINILTFNIFVLKSLIDKQVLERVGIRGPILDCVKSLYAHDSAAVRNSEGISDIFDCLMGVKQGCPLSATLFGLFVDGLEQHLMNTVGHDAPALSGPVTVFPILEDCLLQLYQETATSEVLEWFENGDMAAYRAQKAVKPAAEGVEAQKA
ncbi:MAG: reverse transcriptase [Trebouxia sp. A1-2]|nr:MAG: reverse transcriptase [Trebouxia sp. A1-2]